MTLNKIFLHVPKKIHTCLIYGGVESKFQIAILFN